MARIVRGNWTDGKFEQDAEGQIYGVFDGEKILKFFGLPERAEEFKAQFEAEQRRKEVERSREQLSQQDQQERDLRKAGVVVFEPSPQESKAIAEGVRAAAMAKMISKSVVSVPVFKDGKVTMVAEEIGNYDWILQILLSQRMGRNGGGMTEQR